MKKRSVLMGILVASVFSTLSVSHAAERKLVIAGWGGQWDRAQNEAFVIPFEKETGIKVAVVGPTDFGKIKAMVQSGNVEWDVGNAGTHNVLPAAKMGILDRIDYSIVDRSPLPAGTTFEYMCGGHYEAVVVGYRTDVYKDKIPVGWKDLWDVEKMPGARAMSRFVMHAMPAALMADGVPPDKLYPLDENRAFASLDRIKPHVSVWWKLGAQSQTLIKDREVDMIQGWCGRLSELIDRGDPVAISWDQGIFYQSGWFVIKNAPHKKEAMEWINFVTRSKLQARLAELTFYGPTNLEALKYIDKKVLKLIPSAPENFHKMVESNSEYWAENQARLVEKFEQWLMK